MSNSLTALNPEYWSKRMQVVRIDETVFEQVGNMEERALLKKGDTVHRPYRSRLVVQTYTKGTDITPTDLTATDESLAIDQSKVVSFYFDDIDDTQNGYDTANKYADDAGRELYRHIDGRFLGQVVNADLTIDDADFGGTSGTALAVDPANVVKMFAVAKKKLKRANARMNDLVAIVSPSVAQALYERVEGKDTGLGDTTSLNGELGRYAGFRVFESNNLLYTARWTPANNPSNADTITIDGVVFTFVSSIGSTPGNILIGGNTAATLDNLVSALTQGAGAGTTYVAITDASDKQKVNEMSGTDGTTYVDLSYFGGSEAVVSGSETADLWSLEVVHQIFMQNAAIDIVVQTSPMVQFKEDPDRLGKNVHTHTLYGLKTFAEGTDVMVDVKVDASVL